MNNRFFSLGAAIALASLLFTSLGAQTVSGKLKEKLDAVLPDIQSWAADAAVIAAVKACNDAPAAAYADMDQGKWASTPAASPVISSFTKNEAAAALKARKTDKVSEMILSAANGTKVAFLAKPTNWTHKGKPKHDQPMEGKTWIGSVEVDQSTGMQQIQVSVPVVSDGKPIGSLIVGLVIGKL